VVSLTVELGLAKAGARVRLPHFAPKVECQALGRDPMNLTQHQNVHAPALKWSNEETLHVATPYSNPFRWQTRRELMNNFVQHSLNQKNIKLYVGELAYGDRPFEILPTENHRRFRTGSELFHKENIINETIEGFDPDWKYGAYCDGDFTFTRDDWGLEAIHQLQHYDFVQLFSSYSDLSAETYGGSRVTRMNESFVSKYQRSGFCVPNNIEDGGFGLRHGYHFWSGVGATGGAWAFRRSAFDMVGGLLDQCILGHADWFMAFGLVSEKAPDMHDDKYHPQYLAMIDAWQTRARELKRNIGYVDQFAVHHFHGSKKRRGYSTRDLILANHKFNPTTDIKKNAHGIWELTGNKPRMRDEIRQYFISRTEDDPTD
jgi:hypothetical protein